LITAWSNDFGFEGFFERQVEVLGDEGDILICYSTSGNSKNIIKAAQKARDKNIRVVSFLGGSGGSLISISDQSFISPSSKTPLIQEHHTMAGHLICSCVEKILEPNF
jgi:D-sedoheptulose 7-phosphate isomerase